MQRVLILGRGASGKSTLARHLGEITGLPVIELDKIFWGPNLVPTSRERWIEIQRTLVERERWILDGDLGPYDVPEIRLKAADTIIFMDFSFIRCAWRAVRRSRERADFWQWLLLYHRKFRPILTHAVATHAPMAKCYFLRNPQELQTFLKGVETQAGGL
jgi:adenylate kinase family enzyme